jgi:predicted HAD superfamily Cof-like phosphohydrolase
MSKTNEHYIKEFHKAFKVAIEQNPKVELLKLRKTLIAEEIKELFAEIDSIIGKLERGEKVSKSEYAKALKEMADVQVVLSGTAVSIKQFKQFRKAFIRVHRSNMSKLDAKGKPIYREDGKVLKGPNYRAPELSDLI